MDYIEEIKSLKEQLINPGEEQTIEEVMWNDQIHDQIDALVEDKPDHIVKMMMLNHI